MYTKNKGGEFWQEENLAEAGKKKPNDFSRVRESIVNHFLKREYWINNYEVMTWLFTVKIFFRRKSKIHFCSFILLLSPNTKIPGRYYKISNCWKKLINRPKPCSSNWKHSCVISIVKSRAKILGSLNPPEGRTISGLQSKGERSQTSGTTSGGHCQQACGKIRPHCVPTEQSAFPTDKYHSRSGRTLMTSVQSTCWAWQQSSGSLWCSLDSSIASRDEKKDTSYWGTGKPFK